MTAFECSIRQTDVLLITMPFAAVFRPCIGLSLLKGSLAPLRIPSKVLYFTIPFAERIGVDLYISIVNQIPGSTDLLGEWLFSSSLFEVEKGNYAEEILAPYCELYDLTGEPILTPDLIETLKGIRMMIPEFLDACADEVARHSPRIVGFTSTFHQNVASLALAKRIKARHPGTFVVFGGANCEGVLGAELVRQFPFVDAAVSGEADSVFPEMVRSILRQQPVSGFQGVFTRDNVGRAPCEGPESRTPLVENMDELPFLEYDDFFQQHEQSTLPADYPRQILFETARGCWWGERSHCTFCGLSKELMQFRSKSQKRAEDELASLVKRYPGCRVTIVDNILDLRYFKEFIPRLASAGTGVELFYETKANLKKDQVRLMREAGFTSIQPGIESFSNHVLQIMGKGIKFIQNVQLLKWCKEFGIFPHWNILWGFPSEEESDYTEMARLIPLLSHLAPPQSCGGLRLDRFSPHYKRAAELGFCNVRPTQAYFHVYPLAEEAVANLAYHFSYDYQDPKDRDYTRPVWDAAFSWQKDQEARDLFFAAGGAHLLIWDSRPVARDRLTILTDLHRALYLRCDAVSTLQELKDTAEQSSGESFSVQEIEELLEEIIDRGLMIRDHHSYLSLAVPLGNYAPSPAVWEQFQDALAQQDSVADELKSAV